MKMLVTGGAGFIGFHLAKHLAEEGHGIVICDNLLRGRMDDDLAHLIRRPNVRFVNVDLCDKEALREVGDGFDLVYHLAAINGTSHFYTVPHRVLRNNLLPLINVLDWLSEGRASKLVWTSSSEVYAGTVALGKAAIPTPEEVPLAIEDICNPRFSYAASKITGEALCLSYARAYGLAITIVRPHNVYGPRMGHEHVIPQFINRILRREDPFQLLGGEQTRAFCFVDDLVRGMRLTGESSQADGQLFNLGNDQEEVRIADLAHKMFEMFTFQPRVQNLPAPAGSVARRCPDITKARQLLGFRPGVCLEDGLRETWDWYLRHSQG